MRIGLLKKITLLVTIFIPVLIVVADIYSLDLFWRLTRVHHMSPLFADLRTIPDTTNFDHVRENISIDPWGRLFNYPEIWVYIISFFKLFSDPYHTIGLMQLLLYPIFFFIAAKRFKNSNELLAFFFLYCSPPIFLLLERGNNDGLVVVFLVFAICIGNEFFKGVCLAISVSLKLFPIFGIFGNNIARTKSFWFAFILFCPLIIWTLLDLQYILGGTPVGDRNSYGIISSGKLACKIWLKYPNISTCNPLYFYISYYALFAIGTGVFHARNKDSILYCIKKLNNDQTHSELFFVFSAIYLGTLLLLGNWWYRLIVLLPVMYVVLITFGIPRRNINSFSRPLLLMTLFTFLSPYVPIIGKVLPQFGAYLIGILLLAAFVEQCRYLLRKGSLS